MADPELSTLISLHIRAAILKALADAETGVVVLTPERREVVLTACATVVADILADEHPKDDRENVRAFRRHVETSLSFFRKKGWRFAGRLVPLREAKQEAETVSVTTE